MRLKTKSKSATFCEHNHEGIQEMIDFLVKNVETYDDTPPNGPGDTQPNDPVDRLKYKYVVTVTKFFKD